MSIHNRPSMEMELPNMVKMNEIFAVYDSSAAKFAECIRTGLLHTAAEHLQVMVRLDSYFAIHKLEV